MLKDFKEFALKGNVLDLAVAVVIGGAFGKIVTSLVNDLIMPIFGFITSGMAFKEMKYVMSPAVGDQPEAAILYGSFIQNIVDFIIIAFSIFIVIRIITRSRKKQGQDPVPVEPPKPTEQELLTEIRDLLKSNQAQ